MRTPLKTIFTCLFLICLQIKADTNAPEDVRTVVEGICMSCHIPEDLVDTGFDYKVWQLTVSRMSDYSPLTSQEVHDITEYIANGKFERDFFPDRSKKNDSNEEETKELIVPESAKDMETLKKEYNFQPIWEPSLLTLNISRILGYSALVALIIMMLTGHLKSKVKPYFAKIHRAAAYIMIFSVATHSTIYLFKFGTPDVLWFWFGIIASGTLIISEMSGEIRKHVPFIKKYFSQIHFACGWLCFVATTLHCIWIWL